MKAARVHGNSMQRSLNSIHYAIWRRFTSSPTDGAAAAAACRVTQLTLRHAAAFICDFRALSSFSSVERWFHVEMK